jgi:D-tagatose-1,6-bisphosphate aldolase subunit GatZ/KbaZ
LDIVIRHGSGDPVGIYSVCSAHPLVLEAAVLQALDDGSHLLVEATSNQVDQFGGYTGMTPVDFRELVLDTARRHGLPEERVILGGDHLGPNRWQELPGGEAMGYAEGLVEAYVAAGFTKIHLDCSMSCADDPTPLGDDIIAGRAARLARKAEEISEEASEAYSAYKPLYVVGTEVPTPGGARETLDEVQPTSPESARATLATHERAFAQEDQGEAWERVIALVVQPGVEFDHLHVIDYERSAARELRQVPDDYSQLVFEAHSTDYQTKANLSALVEDHWAILKVGPALTFSLREALFALAAIEDELVEEEERSGLLGVLERRMIAEPAQWEKYYPGSPETQRLLRRYSYSDRIRYYWSDPEVGAAQARLLSNLEGREIPPPLLSQYLPTQYSRVRLGELPVEPKAFILDHVRDTLQSYARASTSAAQPHKEAT